MKMVLSLGHAVVFVVWNVKDTVNASQIKVYNMARKSSDTKTFMINGQRVVFVLTAWSPGKSEMIERENEIRESKKPGEKIYLRAIKRKDSEGYDIYSFKNE